MLDRISNNVLPTNGLAIDEHRRCFCFLATEDTKVSMGIDAEQFREEISAFYSDVAAIQADPGRNSRCPKCQMAALAGQFLETVNYRHFLISQRTPHNKLVLSAGAAIPTAWVRLLEVLASTLRPRTGSRTGSSDDERRVGLQIQQAMAKLRDSNMHLRQLFAGRNVGSPGSIALLWKQMVYLTRNLHPVEISSEGHEHPEYDPTDEDSMQALMDKHEVSAEAVNQAQRSFSQAVEAQNALEQTLSSSAHTCWLCDQHLGQDRFFIVFRPCGHTTHYGCAYEAVQGRRASEAHLRRRPAAQTLNRWECKCGASAASEDAHAVVVDRAERVDQRRVLTTAFDAGKAFGDVVPPERDVLVRPHGLVGYRLGWSSSESLAPPSYSVRHDEGSVHLQMITQRRDKDDALAAQSDAERRSQVEKFSSHLCGKSLTGHWLTRLQPSSEEIARVNSTKLAAVLHAILHICSDDVGRDAGDPQPNRCLVFVAGKKLQEQLGKGLKEVTGWDPEPVTVRSGRKARSGGGAASTQPMLWWSLTREQLGRATQSGGQSHAVAKFKASTKHAAMILPLATGNGLNITEANHVILVQPVLDRALEDQAIARALRLGQERTVWVHRFVAHDTIEEHVLRIADRQVLGGGGPEAEDEGITFADVEGIADAANPHSC
jgi:hypothetical protein